MAKKVSWSKLKKELDSIFGEDETILDKWEDEQTVSPVLNFLKGENVNKLKEVNIELLAALDEPDYDSHIQGDGMPTFAVFSLDDKIYKVSILHYSYSGHNVDEATAEEVAPKIKQIIYYD